MRIQTKHYIDGAFVESTGNERLDVINPATEEVIGQIANGTPEDVDRAVQAAKKAFPSFSKSCLRWPWLRITMKLHPLLELHSVWRPSH